MHVNSTNTHKNVIYDYLKLSLAMVLRQTRPAANWMRSGTKHPLICCAQTDTGSCNYGGKGNNRSFPAWHIKIKSETILD
jgi:hypothetical protein